MLLTNDVKLGQETDIWNFKHKNMDNKSSFYQLRLPSEGDKEGLVKSKVL